MRAPSMSRIAPQSMPWLKRSRWTRSAHSLAARRSTRRAPARPRRPVRAADLHVELAHGLKACRKTAERPSPKVRDRVSRGF